MPATFNSGSTEEFEARDNCTAFISLSFYIDMIPCTIYPHAEATVAAAIRSEPRPRTNTYNSVPTTSEPCADIGASLNGCVAVQYRNHNKPADEDAYMVMCGRKRSVCSPLPPELPPTLPELNKEALYDEIGNK